MTIEYPAMVYKNQRNNSFVANCFMKNIIGFGKTEEAALKNLKESLDITGTDDITVTPMYNFLVARLG